MELLLSQDKEIPRRWRTEGPWRKKGTNIMKSMSRILDKEFSGVAAPENHGGVYDIEKPARKNTI